MKIDIVLYGITRDIIGGSKLQLDLEDGLKVKDILKNLKVNYPELNKLKSLMIAVNDEYATDDQFVQNGDEVVLIPPVSGG